MQANSRLFCLELIPCLCVHLELVEDQQKMGDSLITRVPGFYVAYSKCNKYLGFCICYGLMRYKPSQKKIILNSGHHLNIAHCLRNPQIYLWQINILGNSPGKIISLQTDHALALAPTYVPTYLRIPTHPPTQKAQISLCLSNGMSTFSTCSKSCQSILKASWFYDSQLSTVHKDSSHLVCVSLVIMKRLWYELGKRVGNI